MDLTVYPAHAGQPRPAGKSAVYLCGGGITGALFEVGVLAGLDDMLGRASSTEFDIYVGASAGASVSSIVSPGVPAARAFDSLGSRPRLPISEQSTISPDFIHGTCTPRRFRKIA
jgi:predicted acylesterase/phospholipase RssA